MSCKFMMRYVFNSSSNRINAKYFYLLFSIQSSLRLKFCSIQIAVLSFKTGLSWVEFINCEVKHVRTNVEAPVKQKNLRSTQDLSLLLDSLLILLICVTKILRCPFSLTAISNPCYFHFCFHLLQFGKNTLTILKTASLNKLD